MNLYGVLTVSKLSRQNIEIIIARCHIYIIYGVQIQREKEENNSRCHNRISLCSHGIQIQKWQAWSKVPELTFIVSVWCANFILNVSGIGFMSFGVQIRPIKKDKLQGVTIGFFCVRMVSKFKRNKEDKKGAIIDFYSVRGVQILF